MNDIIFWFITLPLRRLLVELRYRRSIKEYQPHPLWEMLRIPIEMKYAIAKAFL